MKKMFNAFTFMLAFIVSFSAHAVPDIDPDNDGSLTTDLNNSYVSQDFLDYLSANAGNSAYNSISINGISYSDFQDYFIAASTAEQSGRPPRKAVFLASGDLSDINVGELDPDVAGGGDGGLNVPLSGTGLFFISDASDQFRDNLDAFVQQLTITDAATNSNVQLAPTAQVVYYTTNDGNTAGRIETYDVAGIAQGGSGIVNVPIDGGLSFLALGGIAFGISRMRRKK